MVCIRDGMLCRALKLIVMQYFLCLEVIHHGEFDILASITSLWSFIIHAIDASNSSLLVTPALRTVMYNVHCNNSYKIVETQEKEWIKPHFRGWACIQNMLSADIIGRRVNNENCETQTTIIQDVPIMIRSSMTMTNIYMVRVGFW